jgi:hypothetical protein
VAPGSSSKDDFDLQIRAANFKIMKFAAPSTGSGPGSDRRIEHSILDDELSAY